MKRAGVGEMRIDALRYHRNNCSIQLTDITLVPVTSIREIGLLLAFDTIVFTGTIGII